MKISDGLYYLIKNTQMYKFLVVGFGTASFVLIFTFLLTSFLQIHYIFSIAITFESAVIWSFFVHDKWTFGDVKKNSRASDRFIKFNLISLAGLGIVEIGTVFFTIQLNFHYSISEAIAIFIAFFFNFFFQKKYLGGTKLFFY